MAKKPIMGFVQPTKFMVKISSCGTDTFRWGYKRIENEDALLLIQQAVGIISDAFVGEKDSPTLKYQLACSMLNMIDGWKDEGLIKDIRKSKEFLDKWKFKKIETPTKR